jgi:hypothetical protein
MVVVKFDSLSKHNILIYRDMSIFIIIILCIIYIELWYKPRINVSGEHIILWYGKGYRKWIYLK